MLCRMRLTPIKIFLTLVLSASFAVAAPTTKTTLDPAPLNSQPDPLLADKNFIHDKLPSNQINVAVGYTGGNLLENDQWAQGPVFSLRYSPLGNDLLPKWDFQGELDRDNILGLFVGRRWYINEDEFQPYARLAGGSFFTSSEEFGNLVQIKRWRARASLGIGDRLNFEAGFGVAVTGPDLFATLGYNFNF